MNRFVCAIITNCFLGFVLSLLPLIYLITTSTSRELRYLKTTITLDVPLYINIRRNEKFLSKAILSTNNQILIYIYHESKFTVTYI